LKKYDENIFRHKNSLIIRYNYLYKYASFVLAQILHEHKKDFRGLCEDITIVTGICIDDDIYFDRNYVYNNQNLSIFHLVEEFLFSDKYSEDTELYKLIENIKISTPSVYDSVRRDFLLNDKNVGVNKKDIAMQVLLELMRSHIFNQDYNTTRIVRKVDNDYERFIDLSFLPFVRENVTSIVKGYKQAALEQYLNICCYRNLGFGAKKVNNLLVNFQLPVIREKSLVGNNEFLKAIWDLDGKLTLDEIRHIYFKTHIEIPWDTKTNCLERKDKINRVEGIKPCGSTIYLKEDNIFYRDESFFMICPKCGYMINVDGLIESKDIRRRIEFKYWGDKFILRKQDILSELVSIDGMDKAKSLVKERK